MAAIGKSVEVFSAAFSTGGTESQDLFRAAVSQVITDEGFQLPTEPAKNALTCAEKLLKWIDSNRDGAKELSGYVVGDLRKCFVNKCKSPRTARDKIWEQYHKLRSSDCYKAFWKKALSESIGLDACPIFYQYVTDKIMNELIAIRFPIGSDEPAKSAIEEISPEHLSALRYTAGSVLRSARTKIKKSAHPLKMEMLVCLAEMLEQSECDTRAHISEQWTDLVDRGGLIHISDSHFSFFLALEIEVKLHFSIDNPGLMKTKPDALLSKLLDNDDVQFHWSIISANWVEEEAEELLKIIVKQWITLRGFSFASSFNEMYKKELKKTIQKSKGTRKNLIGKGKTTSTAAEEECSSDELDYTVAADQEEKDSAKQ